MTGELQVSAAFATAIDTPEHVQIAEELGYARAWMYDTPQQSPDVWMMLALAAQRTRSIGLGPGVLVPTLRHPMVNAAAAAALERLAPGRVAIGFGTGFTGRRAMGQPPITWAYMTRYLEAFRGLLRGESVEWDGGWMRMLHPDDSLRGAADIPIYISALGPKGFEVAKSLANGLFAVAAVPERAREFEHAAFLTVGSVREDEEPLDTERLREAAGPGTVVMLHFAYEVGGEEVVKTMPGGEAWLAQLEDTPEDLRHLRVHRGHLMYLNEADTAAWNAGAHALVEHATLTGTAEEVRAKVDALAAQGVTELVYQPAGDIRRELETFAAAMGLAPPAAVA